MSSPYVQILEMVTRGSEVWLVSRDDAEGDDEILSLETGGDLVHHGPGDLLLSNDQAGNLKFVLGNAEMLEARLLELGLRFRDEGVGMSPELQQQIFAPFFTTKETGKGTGLGLPAVYGTFLAHEGSITVDSEVGRGTTLTLLLPLAESGPVETAAAPSTAKPADQARVLLVDDDDPVRDLGARVLRRNGYQVMTATNGAEGVHRFEETHRDLDLVVLDIIMPVMNGHDALRAMHEIDAEVPVLIVSGFLDGFDCDEIQAAGASRILRKPYTRDELLQHVAETCRTGTGPGGEAGEGG